MSTAVQKLIHSFESLAEEDQRQAVDELLRRSPETWPGPLAEETLIALSDELFAGMDEEEASHADA